MHLLRALPPPTAPRPSLPGTERVAELFAGAKGQSLADQDYAAVAGYLARMARLVDQAPPDGLPTTT
jgi:hypothetical protein